MPALQNTDHIHAAAPALLAALESFMNLADPGNATGDEELAVYHRAKVAIYLAKGGEKFARKCDITGVGMNDGWTDGETAHAATEEAAEKLAVQLGYKSLADAQEDDDDPDIFWTEWEVDEEGEGWYMADGTFIEPTKAQS